MAEMTGSRFDAGDYERGAGLSQVVNAAGAILSLALIGGIGVWGYQTIMRDVSGVPVVRALEGPMREAPAEPGGRMAPHQGLSVNAVAARGAAAPPPDRVIIAPPPLDLTPQDAPGGAVAEPGDVHLTGLPRDVEDAVAQAAAPVTGGIARSPRPRPRPAAPDPVAVAIASVLAAAAREADAAGAAAPVPDTSRLVQLGAFDSEAMARAEWDRLRARLGDLLDGKRHVVQQAETGGRSFYRLRVAGFADIDDARRFCSALVAEAADCIPVRTR